jgi:hypothetical protein
MFAWGGKWDGSGTDDQTEDNLMPARHESPERGRPMRRFVLGRPQRAPADLDAGTA